MNKRLRFLISSLIMGVVVTLFMQFLWSKPVFSSLVFVMLYVLLFWFGLGFGIKSFSAYRLGFLILPTSFNLALFQLLILVDKIWVWNLVVGFGVWFINYLFFLIFNIFSVTLERKTPALYRSAATVSLFASLVCAFLNYNFFWSLRLGTVQTVFFVALFSAFLVLHYIWVTTVEEDKDLDIVRVTSYLLVPVLIMLELCLVLTFWTSGIFLTSLYLTLAMYVMSQVVVVAVSGRNVEKTYGKLFWVSVVSLIAILASNFNWR